MFTILLNKITSILTANTLVQEVFAYEPEELKGDPVAVIVPSANENDYYATGENVRIYAFTIRLYVNRTVRDKTSADRVLRTLVDSVIDDFDKDYTFSGLVVPTGYMFVNTFALPSSWGYSGREDEYRVAELLIKCRVAVDLNSIS